MEKRYEQKNKVSKAANYQNLRPAYALTMRI
jgi:hypothetical protein